MRPYRRIIDQHYVKLEESSPCQHPPGGCLTLPAASTIHLGDFADLPATYACLGNWLEQNGYQLAGRAREIYRRAPSDEEPALTEIQLPVERKTT